VPLRAIARELSADNPKQGPSLFDWSARPLPLSNVHTEYRREKALLIFTRLNGSRRRKFEASEMSERSGDDSYLDVVAPV